LSRHFCLFATLNFSFPYDGGIFIILEKFPNRKIIFKLKIFIDFENCSATLAQLVNAIGYRNGG